MSGGAHREEDVSQLELELYFLIARFLSSGPCKGAAEVLKQELEEHKLLFRRLDWKGGEHFRSFDNLVDVYNHTSADHLLKVCQRIGPLLEKDVKSSVRGVASLLGAGRQSILRTDADVNFVRWSGSTHATKRHGSPLLPPRNLTNVNIPQVLFSKHLSGVVSRSLVRYPKMYARMSLLSRSLGHLSAVYCVTFDRSGSFFVTGADDHLVKIWSSVSGRLMATLRGHSTEITDIAINYENTLLATGSCDKTIRVWCLKTMAPVAVLHAHTGMITSLQFCPFSRGEHRYLMSTGGDGCVCFWCWTTSNNYFSPKPLKFIERSRAGAQMLCSSFSPGGVFLATGSSDQVVRVYCFTSAVPEKICELEAHTDRVDSIQYSNRTNRFVSGSKDGTARIWRYERQEWKAEVLNASAKTIGATSVEQEDSKANKCKVNMVSWSMDDKYVFVAINDFTLKVWDSFSGRLLHILSNHNDEVFVLENNPVDPNILLSAGHDGNIILWDISAGNMIKSFFNNIEGQGHGAVYDVKWSPDGQSFAATDSHGFSMLYGFGTTERYKKLPEEMFFHTDYRPLIRDANNFVLDEQTQQPPHLMPPPFLVDIDGNPHPSWLQRLVPGRENASSEQLVPTIGFAPNGDREVLDVHIPIDDVEPMQVQPDHRPSIDDMIMLMQREQDHLRPHGEREEQAPHLPPPDGPMSPPSHARGPRRSGEVEGVRVASGNVPVSQQATANDIAAWQRRVVVRGLDPGLVKSGQEARHHLAEEEIHRFVLERKKKPHPSEQNDSSDSGQHIRTRRQRQRRGGRSSRSTTSQQTGRNRLTTRALYDTEEAYLQEEEEEEHNATGSENDAEGIDSDQMWHSSSSDSESSEYSDWAADGGLNLQPPKRSTRQPKKKKLSSSEEEEEEEDVDTSRSDKKKSKSPPKKKGSRKEKRERKQRQVLQHQESIQELPEEYRPPDWLTNTTPRKTPYVPQMGDEIIYFPQGHRLYVNAVKNHRVYEVNPNKNQPWNKLPNLRDQELVKVVGLKYEVRPPRLVCLKLAFIDTETLHPTGGTFTIKYHDMPDVIDFLVLKQTYSLAMSRNWKRNDRFRSMIDDAWWMGTIVSQEPFQQEFQDSMFQCFNVHWDNGETEKMSPWDLEPVDPIREPDHVGGSIPVTQEEFTMMIYSPKEGEWPDVGRDIECERIAHGLEAIMTLSIGEHFLAPVDLNAFPAYAMLIEYPVDLSTIKARIENRYYRRITSVQYDVRCIECNARRFNEPQSNIVKCAKLLTELCLRFISDENCLDPMPIYAELAKDVDFKITTRTVSSQPEYDEDTEVDIDEPSSSSTPQKDKRKKKKTSVKIPDKTAWRSECHELLHTMLECEDSRPFRAPVDPFEYPTYHEIIGTPMDLGTICEQLDCGFFESPMEFCKDVRLVFNNSRTYNTNKRSRIYAMTLRMSAMFEDQVKEIVTNWKAALKYEKTGKLPRNTKKKAVAKTNGNAPSTSTPKSRVSGASSTSPETSTPGRANNSGVGRSAVHGTRSLRPGSSAPTSRTRPASPRKENRRSGRAVKRKRLTSSEEEVHDHSIAEAHYDSDTECEEYYKPAVKKPASKKKRPAKRSQRKGKGKALANGHTRQYSTRNTTGRHAQRYYDSTTEVEDSSATEVDTSNDDTEEDEAKPADKKTTRLQLRVKTSITGSELKPKEASTSNTSSSSASESHSDSNESASSSEGNSSGPAVRRSRRTTTRQNTKATNSSMSSEANRRSLSSDGQKKTSPRLARPKTFRDDSSYEGGGNDTSSRAGTSRRSNLRVNTRNRGKRTVRYEEDSDFEYAGRLGPSNSENSDNNSDNQAGQTVSMSSRGRIRKLTPRARASLLGNT